MRDFKFYWLLVLAIVSFNSYPFISEIVYDEDGRAFNSSKLNLYDNKTRHFPKDELKYCTRDKIFKPQVSCDEVSGNVYFESKCNRIFCSVNPKLTSNDMYSSVDLTTCSKKFTESKLKLKQMYELLKNKEKIKINIDCFDLRTFNKYINKKNIPKITSERQFRTKTKEIVLTGARIKNIASLAFLQRNVRNILLSVDLLNDIDISEFEILKKTLFRNNRSHQKIAIDSQALLNLKSIDKIEIITKIRKYGIPFDRAVVIDLDDVSDMKVDTFSNIIKELNLFDIAVYTEKQKDIIFQSYPHNLKQVRNKMLNIYIKNPEKLIDNLLYRIQGRNNLNDIDLLSILLRRKRGNKVSFYNLLKKYNSRVDTMFFENFISGSFDFNHVISENKLESPVVSRLIELCFKNQCNPNSYNLFFGQGQKDSPYINIMLSKLNYLIINKDFDLVIKILNYAQSNYVDISLKHIIKNLAFIEKNKVNQGFLNKLVTYDNILTSVKLTDYNLLKYNDIYNLYKKDLPNNTLVLNYLLEKYSLKHFHANGMFKFDNISVYEKPSFKSKKVIKKSAPNYRLFSGLENCNNGGSSCVYIYRLVNSFYELKMGNKLVYVHQSMIRINGIVEEFFDKPWLVSDRDVLFKVSDRKIKGNILYIKAFKYKRTINKNGNEVNKPISDNKPKWYPIIDKNGKFLLWYPVSGC